MGIETSLIHNLIRTYQRVLNQPAGKQPAAEGSGRATEDRVSISPKAREYEGQQRIDPVPHPSRQQDKEGSR
ncbi:MAG: hypothetical protein NTX84_08135 [Nitrospirae bacterium]|nr:hypothetical protein [Nitrospirota bacterium]